MRKGIDVFKTNMERKYFATSRQWGVFVSIMKENCWYVNTLVDNIKYWACENETIRFCEHNIIIEKTHV